MYREHIVFFHQPTQKCFKIVWEYIFSKDDDCISRNDANTKSTQVGI
jgi:hypothetical protein